MDAVDGRARSVSRSRRRLLCWLGTSGLVTLVSGNGCDLASDPAPTLEISLQELSPGDRAVRRLDGGPVEIRRTLAGEVEARSLLCTHMGCRVRWQPDVDEYHCACHGGKFARDGSVVAGPPRERLRALEVQIVGDRIMVRMPTES